VSLGVKSTGHMNLQSRRQHANQNPDEVRMTLGEHLEELRSRLIRILAATLIGAVVCYIFVDHIIGVLNWPVYTVLENLGLKPQMIITNLPEAFLTDLKISGISGLILAAPYALYQLWGFVAAGLYSHERRWVQRFAPVSVFLFYLGVIFLIVVVNPILTNFLLTYRTEFPDYGKHLNWILKDKQIISVEDRQKAAEDNAATQSATTQPAFPAIPAYEEDPKNPPSNMLWINLSKGDLRLSFQNKIYKFGDIQETAKRNRLVGTCRFYPPFVPGVRDWVSGAGGGRLFGLHWYCDHIRDEQISPSRLAGDGHGFGVPDTAGLGQHGPVAFADGGTVRGWLGRRPLPGKGTRGGSVRD